MIHVPQRDAMAWIVASNFTESEAQQDCRNLQSYICDYQRLSHFLPSPKILHLSAKIEGVDSDETTLSRQRFKFESHFQRGGIGFEGQRDCFRSQLSTAGIELVLGLKPPALATARTESLITGVEQRQQR